MASLRAPALANTQASASKQTPQLSLRDAMSVLCLSCRRKSIQSLNVVQIQGFECKFWEKILNIQYFEDLRQINWSFR